MATTAEIRAEAQMEEARCGEITTVSAMLLDAADRIDAMESVLTEAQKAELAKALLAGWEF